MLTSNDGPALDLEAAREWHYPINRPIRDYQFNIVQKALFHNTLVALPTGLGKTFIAATVIANYARWFPEGKIVFMAPIRPLVTQQLAACCELVGLRPEDVVELTGTQPPIARAVEWKSKKVFFLTPQVMQNDLISDTCPAEKMVCLVFDEAHRALGKYAYCEVIRLVSEKTQAFRVLALTATPASSIPTVQNIVENLLISRIEVRTEESIDILPYIHKRQLDQIVIKPSAEINELRAAFERDVFGPYIEQLCHAKALYSRDVAQISQYSLIQSREAFRQKGGNAGAVEGLFAIAMSLCHSYELLIMYGIVSFYNHLTKLDTEEGALKSRIRHELNANRAYEALLSRIVDIMGLPLFCSHPKLEVLERLVLEHFTKTTQLETRVLVFSQFKESVMEITQRLTQHAPLLKVMSFVGQSGSVGSIKAFTQKDQIEVLNRFRNGNYNVLVCTCIGEEGLDIGNVDLIICYDTQSSPIRMLQRMGRTGRQRGGRICLLLSEGREEFRYKRTKQHYQAVQRAIIDADKHFKMYGKNPRLIPPAIAPTCVNRHFTATIPPLIRPLPSDKKATPTTLPTLGLGELDMLNEAYVLPSLSKHISWQRTSNPYYKISHSHQTRQLVELLNHTEAVEDELPSISCISRSAKQSINVDMRPKAEDSCLVPRHKDYWELDYDLGDLKRFLDKELAQLPSSDFADEMPAEYYADFQRLFLDAEIEGPARPKESAQLHLLDQLHSMRHSPPLPILALESSPDGKTLSANVSSNPQVEADLILPDAFFDDDEDGDENASTDILESNSPQEDPSAHPSIVIESPLIARTASLLCAKIPEASSPAFMPPLAQRRTTRQTIGSSSPVERMGPPRKRIHLPKKCGARSAVSFFDLEAAVSGEEDSDDDGEDENESPDSMNSFLDDRSQFTQVIASSQTTVEGVQGDIDMMAFYRQSIMQSQPDPRFKTLPHQFSRKLKLTYDHHSSDDSSGEPKDCGDIDKALDSDSIFGEDIDVLEAAGWSDGDL